MPISKRIAYLLFLTIFTLQSCQAIPRFFNDTRPNFLIIVTDDQRFDTMQYMPITQSLIFNQGVTFSHGYITTPFCCPSRASILTGMYAHNHNVHVNEDKLNFPTVVEDLHNNGYYTGLVGKYLNSWNGDVRPEFDYWVSFFGGTVPTYYDPDLNVNGKWQKLTGYMTYLFKDYVIDFLDKATRQRKPFLLLFTPNAPHPPYTPAKEDNSLFQDLPPFRPPSYNEADMSDKPASIANKALLDDESIAQIDRIRRRQILTLVALDRSIGEILAKLKETGEMDNTVIIFISDNGKHWGEHRLESKSTAYEESVKVPFALRYPGLVPAPYIEDKLASNIDIAPTIYELSDTPIPATVDGLSLVNLISGKGEWRDHLLLEAWPDRGHWTAIHTGQYVYIETDNDTSEFYNLATDPFQMENMINDPQYQSIILKLQAYLQKEEVPRTPIPEE
jgi:arylsulfatase A-like enzyme